MQLLRIVVLDTIFGRDCISRKFFFRNGHEVWQHRWGTPTLTIQAGLIPTRDDEFDANEDQHDPNPIPPRGGPT